MKKIDTQIDYQNIFPIQDMRIAWHYRVETTGKRDRTKLLYARQSLSLLIHVHCSTAGPNNWVQMENYFMRTNVLIRMQNIATK